MEKQVNQALSFYDLHVKSIAALNDDNDIFKLTDYNDKYYCLKIYSESNNHDITPEEAVYHTYEQVQVEAEILYQLSHSVLKTASPIKNVNNEFVTKLVSDTNNDTNNETIYVVVMSFVEGLVKKIEEPPSIEMAYYAGVAAAQLHLESRKRLVSLALKRPHKRQDYMHKIHAVLEHGLTIGSLSPRQYEMVNKLCGIILNCMNLRDEDNDNNVGLVHTDIQSSNIVYFHKHVTLIDFSRCVYSYYLYDLAEMTLHGCFGGAGSELQKAILQGYHSVKPLTTNDIFDMQIFFVMFILMVMAESIEERENSWRTNVFKWFDDEVYPGLISGKGYLNASVYKDLNCL